MLRIFALWPPSEPEALVISQAVQPSEGVGLLVAEFKRKLDAFPAAFALGLLTRQALSFFLRRR